MTIVDQGVLGVGLLLLASVVAARLSERLRLPALVLFLILGMLAGSDGPGGIVFDSLESAQTVGTVALVLILFAGGLDTEWATVRPVLAPGLLLSTVGVLITAFIVGTAAWWLLGSFSGFQIGQEGLTWTEGLLLGAIVASTDAAAIFPLFRGGGPMPKPRIRALLELEAGSNDPMAVILTTTLIGLLLTPSDGPGGAVLDLGVGLALGVVVGVGMGLLAAATIERIALNASGLYPALALAFGLSTYGLTELLTGNGFLAVYVSAVLIGNRVTTNHQLIVQVNDAVAWVAQIAMFLVMGLLVFPSQLLQVAPAAIALAVVLIFVARPISVVSCLKPFGYTRPEMTYVAWSGLKGAVPIVLATFPATLGVEAASELFSVVFFVVLVSVLVQGWSQIPVGRRLGVLTQDD
ncbi:MAG: potassium/proton antiporter [Ornithinimicrobium sp.]